MCMHVMYSCADGDRIRDRVRKSNVESEPAVSLRQGMERLHGFQPYRYCAGDTGVRCFHACLGAPSLCPHLRTPVLRPSMRSSASCSFLAGWCPDAVRNPSYATPTFATPTDAVPSSSASCSFLARWCPDALRNSSYATPTFATPTDAVPGSSASCSFLARWCPDVDRIPFFADSIQPHVAVCSSLSASWRLERGLT